jgi:predicted nuclease of predicted toxin-antitoxin system
MRFLADMGISLDVVTWLRAEGHEVDHLTERNLHKSSDSDILELARSEDRIVLTHDLDFGYLLAVSRSRLPSVIIFRLANMRPSNVIAHLHLALARHHDALGVGAILSVSERRIRVRHLPL